MKGIPENHLRLAISRAEKGDFASALSGLDDYYRERLDGYGGRITELEDRLRGKFNLELSD